MGRVCVSVDIYLDSCVDSYDAKTADYLWRVTDFRLTECETILEDVDVVVNLHQAVVAYCERTSRSVLYTTCEHHINDSILKHLGIDVEVRNVLILRQSSEDSVGCCTYTTLKWKE